MKLCIRNSGEIDENALFLLGASTKEGQGKIGFFGSGNKYAIATLLRLGVPFEIYSGERRIEVTTTPVDFRGEHFDQISINGKETSFTTRMGPSWELWYALREFYCNALDEGSAEMFMWDGELEGIPCVTTILVEGTAEVMEFWEHRERYFAQEVDPLWTADTEFGTVRVLEGDGKRRVFRKGICVFEEDRPASFWYDFDNLTINESRVAQYSYEYLQGIAAAIIMAPSEELVNRCLPLVDGNSVTIEACAMYQYIVKTRLSDAWKETLAGREIIRDSWVPHLPHEDVLMGVVVIDNLVNVLQKQAPELRFRDKCNEEFEEADVTGERMDMLNRALKEMSIMFGYSNNPEEILFGHFKTEGTMATYSKVDGKVRLSIDYLDDYDELLSTLFEELVMHKQLGYDDGSRLAEQYLMKNLIEAKRELTQARASEDSTRMLIADMRSMLEKAQN